MNNTIITNIISWPLWYELIINNTIGTCSIDGTWDAVSFVFSYKYKPILRFKFKWFLFQATNDDNSILNTWVFFLI